MESYFYLLAELISDAWIGKSYVSEWKHKKNFWNQLIKLKSYGMFNMYTIGISL